MIPNDPIMLLSFVNMKLRDEFNDLDDLCRSLDADRSELTKKLNAMGYRYDAASNQFK